MRNAIGFTCCPPLAQTLKDYSAQAATVVRWWAVSSERRRSLVIGVAGGSASGKTTVTERIIAAIGPGVAVMEQDAYYKDQSHLPLSERGKTNYDHPAAFDNDLLISHLEALLAGVPIEKPVYDFTQHTRSSACTTVLPQPVIVLEGILILDEPRLRELLDIKVFVDADPDVRFIRRLQRDIAERQRTMPSVIEQYLTYVRPMHLQFIEPSRRYADIIIPGGGRNEVALDLLITKIRSELS
ncbi:MAG: uridine kinase [Deinococcus sp.]|nr:uridine kinase [Deinococcus sp.]